MFFSQAISDAGIITFDPTESRHCLKVLRKRPGDTLEVTDGKGMIYQCRLLDENLSGCHLTIEKGEQGKDVRENTLHIAVSPLKNPSRFEWFLEKATETGIGEITPLICHRTEKQHFKPERFQNLLISAMKQSGRSLLPRLNQPVKFRDIITDTTEAGKYIAWCGTDPKPLLKDLIRKGESALILIGPEGDFTAEEVEQATGRGFFAVSLGDARLRTETAALAACFTFNLVNL
ncbi:MAG: RsmE family RNA methyltransferase [Bacteroidales bacterium]